MATSPSAAALAGVLAGLAIAMPLGSIALLLLRLGMLRGFRVAAAAAVGVGSVDFLYCGAAVAVGSHASTVISEWGSAPIVVSGLVVIGIGLRQLSTSLTPAKGVAAPSARGGPFATYARYFALTALNPLTILYFLALASVIANATAEVAAKAAFVAGTGGASITWQLGLAGVGAVLHRTVSERTGRALGIAASAVVMCLGVAVVVRAFL